MLFHPPEEIKAEVFSRVPDALRKPSATSKWAMANRPGHPADCFLEGPSFDRDGNLYLVDIPNGRIFRVGPDGDFDTVTEYDGWPNGLKIHTDGRLFVADYRHGIMVIDPATGTVEALIDHRWSEGFRGCNDLFFATNGDLYFTDQGQTGMHDQTGRVYRYSAAGRLECLIHNGPSPNGLVMNPSETILYVAMTRANNVWRVPILPDATTSKVGVYVQLSGGLAGPDGLCMGSNGELVVAHCGLGSVWVFDPLGQPLYRVTSPDGVYTTNVAFGGADNRDLYITESDTGTVLRARLPVSGELMYGQR